MMSFSLLSTLKNFFFGAARTKLGPSYFVKEALETYARLTFVFQLSIKEMIFGPPGHV